MPIEHLYLSPHFDDAVLSCGARIHAQASRGERVTVWTVCAGEAPPGALSEFALELHGRWGVDAETALRVRRAEDEAACRVLGAVALHHSIPDAIYRRHPQAGVPLYHDRDSIFSTLHHSEEALVANVADALRMRAGPEVYVYAPLAAGGHVDHQLVRRGVEVWGGRVEYYEDFPYAVEPGGVSAALGDETAWERSLIHFAGADLKAKMDAIECYGSQLSSFWPDRAAMRTAVRNFALTRGAGGEPAERFWILNMK